MSFGQHRGMGPTPAALACNALTEVWTKPVEDVNSVYEMAKSIRASYAPLRDPEYVSASAAMSGRRAQEAIDADQGLDFSPEPGCLVVNSTRP
jgi:hypothetical protein